MSKHWADGLCSCGFTFQSLQLLHLKSAHDKQERHFSCPRTWCILCSYINIWMLWLFKAKSGYFRGIFLDIMWIPWVLLGLDRLDSPVGLIRMRAFGTWCTEVSGSLVEATPAPFTCPVQLLTCLWNGALPKGAEQPAKQSRAGKAGRQNSVITELCGYLGQGHLSQNDQLRKDERKWIIGIYFSQAEILWWSMSAIAKGF